MALYRQLVKRAIASYFGGAEQTATEGLGIYYQQGPLLANQLVTAFPYWVKGVPDSFYFNAAAATPPGWGSVLLVRLGESDLLRQALGGPASGWRDYGIPVQCHLLTQSRTLHAEQFETQLDDLIEAFIELVWADRTLGTTNAALYPNPPWPDNRLIVEAGEKPYGIRAMMDTPEFMERKGAGNILTCHSVIQFRATTYFQA